MDISLPALVSILALVILVGISCVNEDLNVGFLGIAFGIIVGGIFSQVLTAAKIMNAFPLKPFHDSGWCNLPLWYGSDQRHYGKTYGLFRTCLQRQYCPCTVNHLYSLHFRNHYRPWQYRRMRT